MTRDDRGRKPPSYVIDGHHHTAPLLQPGLHIVSTPIGNLRDITLRALETLAAADRIYCEDTRQSRKLLTHYGIETPLSAYHEHNAAKVRPGILAGLGDGSALALISDAGTPLVSDPGYRLVAEAQGAGHAIIPVPGASALLAGLVVAGLPTDRFLFAGFLPAKAKARQDRLAELAPLPATLVLYEAPQRLAATLTDLADMFGPRRAAIGRELTKRFEEVRRGPLDTLATDFADGGPVKGEIVIVVAPPDADAAPIDDAEVDRMLLDALRGSSIRDAANAVAEATRQPKRAIYQRALRLKRDRDGEVGTEE